MFVTKDEIRQIANNIITDDTNNDILFIIANKGFGKYSLLREIYDTRYQDNVIIVNGELFHSDSIVKDCLIQGIYEYLRRNNSIFNRGRLCKAVAKIGKSITIPQMFSLNFHIKVKKLRIENLLGPLSINNLIDVYDDFSYNSPLVLLMKGTELCEDDKHYLENARSGNGDARLTYIIALRPNKSGISLIKQVCRNRSERIWICPMLPEIKKHIANRKIVNIPAVSLNHIQDSYNYLDFGKALRFENYYDPVFELVAELLSQNLNPAMMFSVANQEIKQEDYEYIIDIAKRLLHKSLEFPKKDALISHKDKYIWVDALAYYIFVNEGIDSLLLEMQLFYFSFLIDISHWRDALEKYEYRHEIAASVLNVYDRYKMNDFLRSMSQLPINSFVPGITDYTSRLTNWIKAFTRPTVNKKVHYSSVERLVNELFSFHVGFSEINIEALHIITNETGRLGPLDIALLITADKLRTKPVLSKTEHKAINKLLIKSFDELIRWSDITLVKEVCDVLVLLKQIDCLDAYYIPTITDNHVIYHYLKEELGRIQLNEGEVIMGKRTVFISYTNADDCIVNVIDGYLTDCGYDVKRDIRDIDDYESIEKFMKSIRKQDFVVPIISDAYLRRNSCMFEIAQLIKDENYTHRTFPVVVDLPKTDGRNYNFFHPLYRAEIIKFWEDETKKLQDSVETISAQNRAELDLEIRRYSNYTQSIAVFLDWFRKYLVVLIPNGVMEKRLKQIALEGAKRIDEKMIAVSQHRNSKLLE